MNENQIYPPLQAESVAARAGRLQLASPRRRQGTEAMKTLFHHLLSAIWQFHPATSNSVYLLFR